MKSKTLNQVYISNNPIENIDKLLGQKSESTTYYSVCSISYKGKNEQDYFKIEQKIMAEHPYISLSRYYGTD